MALIQSHYFTTWWALGFIIIITTLFYCRRDSCYSDGVVKILQVNLQSGPRCGGRKHAASGLSDRFHLVTHVHWARLGARAESQRKLSLLLLWLTLVSKQQKRHSAKKKKSIDSTSGLQVSWQKALINSNNIFYYLPWNNPQIITIITPGTI